METDENGFRPWTELVLGERKKVVRFLLDADCTHKQIAEALSTDRSLISQFCRSHNIPSRGRGAQLGNKNAQTHGLGKNTILRLTKRILVKEGRNLFTCERCGFTDAMELPRHHKDRDRRNNDPSNLEVLCQSCHGIEHINDRQRTDKGTFL